MNRRCQGWRDHCQSTTLETTLVLTPQGQQLSLCTSCYKELELDVQSQQLQGVAYRLEPISVKGLTNANL